MLQTNKENKKVTGEGIGCADCVIMDVIEAMVEEKKEEENESNSMTVLKKINGTHTQKGKMLDRVYGLT